LAGAEGHDNNNADSKTCTEPLYFPKALYNRPGLSSIDYCIGKYSDFRQFLIRKLNSSGDILSGWTHQTPDDPGIALLEGASIICHILASYQEFYANETKLRTAKWKESIFDLVRLVGYRPSPGLGGSATFAIEIKGDKSVVIKSGFQFKAELEGLQKPVEFESEKDYVAYPWLSKFYLYRPLEGRDITKDTIEFYISYPDSHLVPVKLEEGDRLLIGDIDLSNGDPSNPSSLQNTEIVIVDKIKELHDRKLFTIKGSLTKRQDSSASKEVVAYKLGRSFRHFGHNSPGKIVELEGSTAKEVKITHLRPIFDYKSELWLKNRNGDIEKIDISPSLDKLDFPLDSEVNDIASGSKFLILGDFGSVKVEEASSEATTVTELHDVASVIYEFEKLGVDSKSAAEWEAELGNIYADEPKAEPRLIETDDIQHIRRTFIRTIQDYRPTSITWGAITGASTLVSFDSDLIFRDLSDNEYNAVDIRTLQFHEIASPLLKLNASQNESALQPGARELYFFGTRGEAKTLEGRNLLFNLPTKEPITSKVIEVELSSSSSSSSYPSLHKVTVDREMGSNYADFPNENPVVSVYGNLVDTTQGKTERDATLGNGDSRQKFQTFKLPKSPLTYLNVDGEMPPEAPALNIYVNDLMWTRVNSFFGTGPTDQIYIVRNDINGDSWVQFGDGETGGSRLPTGINNIVANFRTGIGAYGPPKAETTVQAAGHVEHLGKIQLLGVASGGSAPESGENAKEVAPGRIQTLGRMVSIRDFEYEARSRAGVSKASARWGLENNIPIVILTVLMEAGREKELDKVKETLNKYNKIEGMQRFPISIHHSNFQFALVDLEYGLDSAFRKEQVEKAIKEALGVSGEEGIDGSNGLFAIRKRNFGQREYLTRIEGVVQNIDGVRWVDVKAIGHSKKPGVSASATAERKSSVMTATTSRITSTTSSHMILKSPSPVISCNKENILTLQATDLHLTSASVSTREMH